jgi:hypothetical protein
MKNLLRKLGVPILASIITFSCATSPKPQDPLGDYLFLYPGNNQFMLGYDTDKDGREDYRRIYQIIGVDAEEESIHAILIATARDENKNGKFDEEEFKKVESSQTEELNLKNIKFSESA